MSISRNTVGCWLAIACLATAGCGSSNGPQQGPVETSTPKPTANEISEMRTRLERSLVSDNGGDPKRVTAALAPFTSLAIAQELNLQQTAADSLARIGVAAVPTLLQALKNDDPKVRLRAAQSLARIGPEAKDAVPALTKALADPDEDVRRQAARALGQIGAAAESAIPALANVMTQPEKTEQFKVPTVEVPAPANTTPTPGSSPSDQR